MCRAFPCAPLVTSVFDPAGTYPDFEQFDVRTTALQNLPFLARHHRFGLPIYAPTFSSVSIDAPLVICSTSGWAHGIRTTGAKALYVHNTARWIYQPAEYLNGRYSRARALTRPLSGPLRRWDHRAAVTADKVWVNSKAVQERVWLYWSLDSEVLYPPHGVDPSAPREKVQGLRPGFLLTVNRLLHYKRVDVLVDAMRKLPDHQLVVVGDGPEHLQLRRAAPSNCRFLSHVSEEKLRWLYANCLGLVSAAHEDLGLAALEAMAFGRPVAVLRRGGFLETVREGRTGVFFDEPSPKAVTQAVTDLASARWNDQEIAGWAERFSERAFINGLSERVRELTGDYVAA